MSNPSSLTRVVRYFIGLVVGGVVGWYLTQFVITEQSDDISLFVIFVCIVLFTAGFFAGLFSYPGDANPYTRKLALYFFLAGIGLSVFSYFSGMAALSDIDSSSGSEGLGIIIFAILFIILAIVGVVTTVAGSIVLLIGAFIGEAISGNLFYGGKSFDKPKASSSKSKSQYCKSCGTRMRTNERQCPSCGNKA
ncbi:MAG: hypothetical protein KAR35_04500 [Candidatus Heimdallarchaeota archaeon]|nr:hypothetical protein [Candidatus Heimdallarchaeota archaeon]MCK5048616.1 hypothetical protein [Candidatus Heimdallarchaeota archaeon]